MTGDGLLSCGARRLREVVMCEPAYFRVAYEINPYMSTAVPVDPERATAQWERLRHALESTGVRVHLLPAHPDLPDMVFASDVGVCLDDTFVRSNFRHPERAAEAVLAARWFAGRGYRVSTLPDGVFFEGMGDFAFTRGGIVLGHGIRSSRLARREIDALPGATAAVTHVELVDPRFYHLGTALAVLSPACALVCEAAFTPAGLLALREQFEELVSVSADEAADFAANVLCVGSTVVAYRMPPRVRSRLAALGFDVIEVDVSEFVKAGGAVACMVLPLYCSA